MRRPLLAGLALLLVLAGRAEAARLVVTIDGMRSAGGHVVVAVYSKPDGFPDGDYSERHTKVKAAVGTLTIVFDDLVPGLYAVGAYHDENDNGRLDTNWIGYPSEGYALSNGIRAVIRRPRFADAAFAVGEAGKHVALHIQY